MGDPIGGAWQHRRGRFFACLTLAQIRLDIMSGKCSEVFATGTAAIVTSISDAGRGGWAGLPHC